MDQKTLNYLHTLKDRITEYAGFINDINKCFVNKDKRVTGLQTTMNFLYLPKEMQAFLTDDLLHYVKTEVERKYDELKNEWDSLVLGRMKTATTIEPIDFEIND